jgi:hypothetical protein
MEKTVSKYQHALAYQEIRDEHDLYDLSLMRHLSLSNVTADIQPIVSVVKVSGNITVSF